MAETDNGARRHNTFLHVWSGDMAAQAVAMENQFD